MVISLERGAGCLHMVQLMPLHPKTPSSLASFKSRLVLPLLYRLNQDVLEKRPLNGFSICVVRHENDAFRPYRQKCEQFLARAIAAYVARSVE